MAGSTVRLAITVIVALSFMISWPSQPALSADDDPAAPEPERFNYYGNSLQSARDYVRANDKDIQDKKLGDILGKGFKAAYTSALIEVTSKRKIILEIRVSANAEETDTSLKVIGTYKPEDPDFKVLEYIILKL